MDPARKNVAVFIGRYSIGKSSPVVCMLDFLLERYNVYLFTNKVSNTDAPILKNKNIKTYDCYERKIDTIKNYLGLHKVRIDKDIIYFRFICFDCHGLVLCKKYFPEAKPIYYSLELCFRDDHFNLFYPEDVMAIEKMYINSVRLLIIQSEEREKLFKKEFDLDENIKTYYLPVTYLGESVREKHRFLRDKYNISNDKLIVLHLGGIQEYHSCIELAETFADIKNSVLIFHGYSFGTYRQKLEEMLLKSKINNVIITNELFDDIDEIDKILMSSDIGIAWYNDVSVNFTTAGKSSGKISAYMRFGLPIIAKKYPSTYEAIEQKSCGICVDDFSEIPYAFENVISNMRKYRENALNEYDKVYDFNVYRKSLLEFIEDSDESLSTRLSL